MILPAFIPQFEEIFALEGLLADPVLIFGVHEVGQDVQPLLFRHRIKRLLTALAVGHWKTGAAHQLADMLHSFVAPSPRMPPDYVGAAQLGDVLRKRGLRDVQCLDLFDPRAALRYDMNRPVPESERGRFHVLLDIGSIEHVFDTRQCIENCMRMVKMGGFYLIHTPVVGYFRHGLHTFNPEALVDSLELNGFEIVHHSYSTMTGIPLPKPLLYDDVLIFLVGRKTRELGDFKIPQQKVWAEAY